MNEKENGDLEDCIVWDLGSLNKTKHIDNNIKPNDKKSIKLNDSVQFGVVRFDLVKVSIKINICIIY